MPVVEEKLSALSLVTRLDGHVLAVWNRNHKGWGLPGGKVEPGESPRDTQRRELFEETGLSTDFAVHAYVAENTNGRMVHVYMVAAKGDPHEVEEGSPVVWVTWPFLLKESPFRDFYRGLLDALRGG